MILHQSSAIEEQTNQLRRCGASVCSDSTQVESTGSIPSRGEIANQVAATRTQVPRGVTHVFVLNKNKDSLMPCHPARARQMLRDGKAIVHQMYPFTIRMKKTTGNAVQPVKLKPDPGSQHTGISLVTEKGKVLFLAELKHRGEQIKQNLLTRKAHRRQRRSQRWYREARFNNRTKPEGWLPPSIQHRIETTVSWAKKLMKICPITKIEIEQVRFDTQKMQNPEISNIEYQQGTLQGYEIREYLLEKWSRKCVYCDKTGLPLQIEHVLAKSKGGTDRVGNLAIACEPCNQAKDNLPVQTFVKNKTRLNAILSKLNTPLKDAAAVNITRHILPNKLRELGIPVECFSGAQTKFNRTRLNIPKTHALDAACVGNVTQLTNWKMPVLHITCKGHGTRSRTLLDKFGCVRLRRPRQKVFFGFQTGDIVRAKITKGKHKGTHIGRIAIRSRGTFDIKTKTKIIGTSYKNCTLLQRNNGYQFHIE
jgi:5-methylcytosine-specific restriction endonuclease McrA